MKDVPIRPHTSNEGNFLAWIFLHRALLSRPPLKAPTMCWCLSSYTAWWEAPLHCCSRKWPLVLSYPPTVARCVALSGILYLGWVLMPLPTTAPGGATSASVQEELLCPLSWVFTIQPKGRGEAGGPDPCGLQASLCLGSRASFTRQSQEFSCQLLLGC